MMLYDPKWEAKATPKIDPEYRGVRLSEFIAWLETKPAGEFYDYTQPEHCALAQFKQSKGEINCVVDLPLLEDHWLERIVHVTRERPTFGAALKRAKKYAASIS